jgi:ABC-type nitrate/sulfonate/bicarbonate transport system substrate-binding protein
VGISQGIFKRHGLKLRLSELPGGQQILPQVSSGLLDVGFTNVVSLIKTRETLGTRSLAGATVEDSRHINHALLAKRGTRIEDHNGPPLRVAVNTKDNIEELAFRRWAHARGLPPTRYAIQAIPFDKMGLALASDTIDIASLVEPFITKLTMNDRNAQVHVLANQYAAIAPVTTVATWATSPAWVTREPKLARAFQRAYDEATQFILVNESETRRIIGQFAGISDDTITVMGLPGFRERLTEADLSPVISAMEAEGWIRPGHHAQDLLIED